MREPVTVWGYRTCSGLHSGLKQPSVMSIPRHGEEGPTKRLLVSIWRSWMLPIFRVLRKWAQYFPSFLESPSGEAKPRILWEVCRCRHLCIPSGEMGAVEANLLAEKDIRGSGDSPWSDNCIL